METVNFELRYIHVQSKQAMQTIGGCKCVEQQKVLVRASIVPEVPSLLPTVAMAAGHSYLTSVEVCRMVTADGEDDTEFLLTGSDDDFDADLQEEYDPLDREQGKCRVMM